MRENAEEIERVSSQCENDQMKMLGIISDTLRIHNMVHEHDMAIKNLASEMKEIRSSFASIKEPIDQIRISIIPLLENYSILKKWFIRFCIFVTSCCGIYLLVGSNAIPLIKFIYNAWVSK